MWVDSSGTRPTLNSGGIVGKLSGLMASTLFMSIIKQNMAVKVGGDTACGGVSSNRFRGCTALASEPLAALSDTVVLLPPAQPSVYPIVKQARL